MQELLKRIINSKLVRKLAGFSITGALSTLISVLLLLLFNEVLHFNAYVSYILLYFISILFSYISNALFVWKSKIKILVFVKYLLVYCSSMALGAFILFVLKQLFPTGNNSILSLLTMPVTMTWNYLFVNKLLSKKDE